jgi:hypothetical protein
LASPPKNVVDIVLHRFPYVGDNVSWEQVLEFRKDPDVLASRNRLRKWLGSMAKDKFAPYEIEREIDCLLTDYEAFMRKHRMAVSHEAMRTAVVGIATILEDLSRFKWGKLAESLFAVTDRSANLIDDEKAPGREISYLVSLKQTFQ